MEQNKLISTLIILIIIAGVLFGLRVTLLKDVNFFAFMQDETVYIENDATTEMEYDSNYDSIEDSSYYDLENSEEIAMEFEDAVLTADSMMSMAMGILIIFAIVYIICIIGMWKIYTKCGYPGWHSIVPILNVYTMLNIVGLPRMDDIIIFYTICWNNYFNSNKYNYSCKACKNV